MYTGRLQITLFVRDVPRSVEYYQRVLGFSLSGYWSPAAQRFVDSGAMIDSTDQAELLAGPNKILLRTAPEQSIRRAAEYSLEVEDLDLVHRRAVASGGLTDRPSVVSNGNRRFTLTDGDGHVWHLVQS